ncbi:MAG: class I SAM-dependent methyltransferase [Cyclobacteriaceae bacterium]
MNLIFSFDPEMEECPVCGSASIHRHKKDYKNISISKCKTCRIEFMNPQYTDQYLESFYSEYQKMDSKKTRYGDKTKPRELVHEYNLKQIEGHVDKNGFLSVGCGNGLDVKVALQRGWQAEGFELDHDHTVTLSKTLGTSIHSGDFASLELEKKYSCVYLNHVLEHPKNPGSYLKKISELLTPGGILYIACPNIDSVSNRIKTVLEKVGLKKNHGKHYDTWHHLIYFNPRKLKKLLESQYGYEVLYMGNDKKAKIDTTSVEHSLLDDVAYKSSFRMIAKKL